MKTQKVVQDVKTQQKVKDLRDQLQRANDGLLADIDAMRKGIISTFVDLCKPVAQYLHDGAKANGEIALLIDAAMKDADLSASVRSKVRERLAFAWTDKLTKKDGTIVELGLKLPKKDGTARKVSDKAPKEPKVKAGDMAAMIAKIVDKVTNEEDAKELIHRLFEKFPQLA